MRRYTRPLLEASGMADDRHGLPWLGVVSINQRPDTRVIIDQICSIELAGQRALPLIEKRVIRPDIQRPHRACLDEVAHEEVFHL